MRKIVNDLCCTLGDYSSPYPFIRHAEGHPDAAAAEAAVVPVKVAVVSDDVPFLPQDLFRTDLCSLMSTV